MQESLHVEELCDGDNFSRPRIDENRGENSLIGMDIAKEAP